MITSWVVAKMGSSAEAYIDEGKEPAIIITKISIGNIWA